MKVKKIASIILLLLVFLFVVSCDVDPATPQDDKTNSNDISYIKRSETVKVGDSFTLSRYIDLKQVYYESSDSSIITIESRFGYAVSVGYALITAKSVRNNEVVSSFIIEVVDNKPEKITITNYKDISIDEKLYLGVSITPVDAKTNIKWISSDDAIATIDQNGAVTGISSGFVRITCYEETCQNVFDEVIIYVKENIDKKDDFINEYENVIVNIDLSNLSDVFEPIIKKARSYTIGVNSYASVGRRTSSLASASGIIFERYCVLKDGTTVLDDGTINDFVSYKYNVITCKHIINGASSVEVYYDNAVIEAEVISFDTKIDLGVISFIDTRYFPVATFADSSKVETGEFVLAVGNSYGKDYYGSVTMGIVSYYSRYVSTDTDNDGTNDWDALYIQHDAAIGDGSSGGPLVNMKGEVIGINSEKISSAKIDNMGFAIPSNLTLELCNQLKDGIVPVRPIFKISVLTVRDILNNDYILSQYPIPEGITYGIYIAEVDPGGVGDACGMMPGDIIVEFDGKRIAYSYELRAAMGEVIIGSNEEINVVVYRDGEYITLKAVF